jgi:hypothetical protein
MILKIGESSLKKMRGESMDKIRGHAESKAYQYQEENRQVPFAFAEHQHLFSPSSHSYAI